MHVALNELQLIKVKLQSKSKDLVSKHLVDAKFIFRKLFAGHPSGLESVKNCLFLNDAKEERSMPFFLLINVGFSPL